ncbi:MAG: relaxase domain-containing protein [Propionicimonas sp.]|uniref:relaxase domain-containing protein n=1 Tax=Propionicimonas sp. TaxID=1955623 RepID=UPI003D131CBA
MMTGAARLPDPPGPTECWVRDLTFGAHFGLSVLMAVADEKVMQRVIACHGEAVGRALALLDSEASFAHVGPRYMDSRGLRTAAEWHIAGVEGHPYLHSHVFVFSLVEALDGRLVPVDLRLLDDAWEAAHSTYLTVLEANARESLSVDFEDRGGERDVVGTDERLRGMWLPARCHRGIEQRTMGPAAH